MQTFRGLTRYQGMWSRGLPQMQPQSTMPQLPALPSFDPSQRSMPNDPFNMPLQSPQFNLGPIGPVPENAPKDFGVPANIMAIYREASQRYGVPLNELIAIGYQESRHGADRSVSSAGAQGVMQLMPGTAAQLGVVNVNDPYQNIMGGAKYYAQLRRKYRGNIAHAMGAYNAGPGRIDNWLAGRGKPLAQETINYMRLVPRWAQFAQGM